MTLSQPSPQILSHILEPRVDARNFEPALADQMTSAGGRAGGGLPHVGVQAVPRAEEALLVLLLLLPPLDPVPLFEMAAHALPRGEVFLAVGAGLLVHDALAPPEPQVVPVRPRHPLFKP